MRKPFKVICNNKNIICKVRVCKLERLPRLGGMTLTRLLFIRFNSINLSSEPHQFGIFPFKLLSPRFKEVRCCSSQIEESNLP